MPPIRRPPLRWGSNPFIRPNPILDALLDSSKKLCREILRLIPEVTDPHVVAGFVSLATDHNLTVELEGARLHDFIKSRYSFHRQSDDHRNAVTKTTHDCVKNYFARCVPPLLHILIFYLILLYFSDHLFLYFRHYPSYFHLDSSDDDTSSYETADEV